MTNGNQLRILMCLNEINSARNATVWYSCLCYKDGFYVICVKLKKLTEWQHLSKEEKCKICAKFSRH
jgi:hypothetical protein